MIINISIKEKNAALKDDAVIVCGNSDYIINFDFDEEWSDKEEKTARFIYDGKVIDLKFSGNSCSVPIITGSREVRIGVFTDTLASSYVRIECRFSALCEDIAGVDTEPRLFPNYEKVIAEMEADIEAISERAETHDWFYSLFVETRNPVTIFNGQTTMKYVPLFDTSEKTNFSNMFNNCYALVSVPKFNTSNGTNFMRMFYNCYALESVPVFDFSKAETVRYLFYNCKVLKDLELIYFSDATNTDDAFYGCVALENVTVIGSINSTISFADSPKLTVESAKNIIRALKNCYNSMEEAYAYYLYFPSEVWNALRAEGRTAPSGETWEEYVLYTLCWNV